MRDLERFVRAATRGLPRHDRARVQQELRGNLLERVAEHQISGSAPVEAERLALLEFGSPARLGAGLRRVHLWPRIGLIGGLGSAALALTLVLLPESGAQRVTVTTQGLMDRCQSGRPTPGAQGCSMNRDFWLSLSSLKQQLQAQQAILETTRRTHTSLGPAGEQLTETYLQVRWTEPGRSTGRFEIPLTAEWVDALQRHMDEASARAGWPERPAPLNENVFQRNQDTFLMGSQTLDALLRSSTEPVRIERPLDGPLLHVGRLRLELGRPGQGVSVGSIIEGSVIRALYGTRGLTVFTGAGLLPRQDQAFGAARGFPQQVRVRGGPGDLYVVVRPVTGQGVRGLGLDLVPVAADGLLHFRSQHESVRFTADLTALNQSGESRPAVALLRLGRGVTLTRSELKLPTPEVPGPAPR
ncbi:permease prefix domain 1-containing protein [Deinococcus sedimenti]|uniref:Uncharacterized protein n=1 Tax=Deinococcus sedimenti TaxID=1867090 RepID=A0ABQ2S979_9DEIO|nr:permease prefix domain 1-containing protein [Deinococcus sedimenti]GGR98898.1 hypothetical protein GCM10008960_26960 [Deinococcus sedimenti]